MISLKKQQKKIKSKSYIAEERMKMLEKFGYNDLKKKHRKSIRPDFPDLKINSKYELSNSIGNGIKKKTGAEHPDAKLFPIQQVHKQGYTLFTRADDPKYAGGKKS